MSHHDSEQLIRIGMSDTSAHAKAGMYAACDAALDAIGSAQERWSVWVPGRIEVFGKHTDYAGGRSLLCAVERGFTVRAALRTDHRLRAIDVAQQEQCDTSLDPGAPATPAGWRHYVSTVARRLARNFPSAQRGVDLAFTSDLPIAAGMSSSSALMIAVFVSLAKSNDLRSSEEFRREIFSREELASYLGCIENGESFRSLEGDVGVGTFGGSQDHTAIMCSEPGRLVQYAFAPVRREAVFALPDSHVFVIATSGVVAEKAAGAREAYNRAARMVRQLLLTWNRSTRRSDRSLADAVRSGADAPDRLRAMARTYNDGEFTGPVLEQRLEQFLLEAFELIPASGVALAHGDMDALGAISDRSQEAATVGLDNQIPETTALARTARQLGATAASAFGAGFGGSVWALVPSGSAASFAREWAARYAAQFPHRNRDASFFISPAGPGAMQW